MVLLICMGNMGDEILSKITRFTILMLVHIIKIMTLLLIFVFSLDITFRIMSTIFSHMDSFKYQNVNSNLNNVTTIHYIPYLADYLLKSLKGNFQPPPSMPVFKWVPFSTIRTNHLFFRLICIYVTNLLPLVLYILTCQPLMMVQHAPSYFLEWSHWFQIYMVWKQINSLSMPRSKTSVHGEND